ncbi:sulfite exporter TauE/SafE family protein [Salibacterium sp. K-3]
MKSKVSFFNAGIQKQNAKQHGWIGMIFLLSWLFIVPLRMLLLVDGEDQLDAARIKDIYDVVQTPQLFVTVGIPVIAGIFLLRYLQLPDAADMMHSLPIKRHHLLANQMISGVVMLVIPMVVTALLTWLAAESYPLYENLSAGDIWSWAGLHTLMALFFFLFTVFTGMMTGISVAAGILAFILLMLPLGLITLINENLAVFLYGFAPNYASSTEQIAHWSPLVMAEEVMREELSAGQVIGFFAGAVVSGALAFLLYRYRHVESATQAVTFKPLQPIFKYGVTFCFMLVGGLYFYQYNDISWLLFGYLVGSLAGYCAAEMILAKTWRIFQPKRAVGYAVYAVVILIAGVAVNMDVFGYETSVPEEEDIQGVHFGHHVHQLNSPENNESSLFHESDSYKAKVREFHEAVTEVQPEERTVTGAAQNMVFAYKMEDGSMKVRNYENISTAELQEEAAAVMESEPYKLSQFHLEELNKDVDRVRFDIYRQPGYSEPFSITDPEELEELKDILSYEITSLSYEEIQHQNRTWGDLVFSKLPEEGQPRDEQLGFDIPWLKSFEELDTWLENNGYLEQARLTTGEIETMKMTTIPEIRNPEAFLEDVYSEAAQDQEVSITEEGQMDTVLKHFESYQPHQEQGPYMVQMETTNGNRVFGVLEEDDLPEEIVSQLQ